MNIWAHTQIFLACMQSNRKTIFWFFSYFGIHRKRCSHKSVALSLRNRQTWLRQQKRKCILVNITIGVCFWSLTAAGFWHRLWIWVGVWLDEGTSGWTLIRYRVCRCIDTERLTSVAHHVTVEALFAWQISSREDVDAHLTKPPLEGAVSSQWYRPGGNKINTSKLVILCVCCLGDLEDISGKWGHSEG